MVTTMPNHQPHHPLLIILHPLPQQSNQYRLSPLPPLQHKIVLGHHKPHPSSAILLTNLDLQLPSHFPNQPVWLSVDQPLQVVLSSSSTTPHPNTIHQIWDVVHQVCIVLQPLLPFRWATMTFLPDPLVTTRIVRVAIDVLRCLIKVLPSHQPMLVAPVNSVVLSATSARSKMIWKANLSVLNMSFRFYFIIYSKPQQSGVFPLRIPIMTLEIYTFIHMKRYQH